jgi:hypothetical protein
MTGMIYRTLAQLQFSDPTMCLVVKAAEGDRRVSSPRCARRSSRSIQTCPFTISNVREHSRCASSRIGRLARTIILAFGTLAAMLCVSALDGMTAYLVQRRTGESGIPMAIGASPSHDPTRATTQQSYRRNVKQVDCRTQLRVYLQVIR